MATFEIEDKFMNAIDLMIKRNGQYKTRSEFFKDATRKRFSEIEEEEWKKKFRESAKKLSDLAYSRGFDGKFPTRKERAKIADEFIKENNITLL